MLSSSAVFLRSTSALAAPTYTKLPLLLSFNFAKLHSQQPPRRLIASSSAFGLSMEKGFQSPKEDPQLPGLEAYIEHVKHCNRGSEERSRFIPFVVDNIAVGFIHPNFVQHLLYFPNVFTFVGEHTEHQHVNFEKSQQSWDGFVALHHSLTTREERTKSVNRALKVLNKEGVIPGWRDEFYPVVEAFGKSSLISLERAAVPYFGTKAYGVHMNGFVSDPSGEKYLWVARRSVTKQTYPGMFDHLVAGGQPVGLSCKENLVKECDEEASIPKAIAERSVAVGAVSYEDIDGDIFKRDILFCYDLELPLDFQPKNKDGEVDSFTLMPVAKVANILQTTKLYKPNCALVIIDFLFRHGYITPDQNGYLQLLHSLRKGECV